VTGTTDDRGEDGAGSVIAGESGFAHTRTVVDDQTGDFFVAHFFCFYVKQNKK
jgi:hypothetical protein